MNFKRVGDSSVCIENKQDEVVYFTFEQLEKLDFMQHLFTTRMGGVSKNDCATMNLNFDRDESHEAVLENYRRIGKIFQLEPQDFVLSHQTHTTNVKIVKKEDAGKGVVCERDYENIDGLITNEPGIALTTIYADCVPLFFADPVKKVVGVSHSGWKGTVLRMGQKTVETFVKEFGSNPEDLVAVVAPSICVNCYEISTDVAKQFIEADLVEGILFHKDLTQVKKEEKLLDTDKFQLNLWEANRQILLQAGLKQNNISVTDICTCCNSDLLFSHRASKGKRGNLAAIVSIK